jgi:UDP-glucose:(heptosyl)LPS alpha-1,3-glucosyltransferase
VRVALVLEQFDPPRGGLERWSWRFAAELLRRGHEVHVVAKRFSQRTIELPIIAHRLEGVRSRLAFAEAAQAALFRLAPEVIHDMGCGWYCDVFHPHGGSWASLAERKLLLLPPWRRPLKRSVDRLLPRQHEFRSLLLRQYVDNGQLLVALSRTVADDFRRFHGVPTERIRVVYNGVDTDRFSPEGRPRFRQLVRRRLGIADETVVALIVAHNFRLKGVPTLLRAMGRLAAERLPVHLVVVGGKHLRPWRRMAGRLRIDGAVSFVGPQEETAPYYAAADVYVHPTFYDTCSLVVLEAAASGLPVITTRINGVSELLTERVDSLLLADPADAEELAEQMRALLDESLRQKMGTAARQTALRHTLNRNVEEMLAVYEEVVGSRRGAAVTRKPSRAERQWHSRPVVTGS